MTTKGIDYSVSYKLLTDRFGEFDFTGSANTNDIKITKVPAIPTQILPTPAPLFARQNILRYEEGTPPYKVTLQTDWSLDNWGGTLRSTFYGDVVSPATLADGSQDVHTGQRSIWDLEGHYTFPHQVTVTLGADNLFDVYPRQIPLTLDTTGAGPFTSFSPFGFGGRFVYGRLSINW